MSLNCPLSLLDLVRVTEGSTPREAIHHSQDIARHADRLGYQRLWIAEHHNMPGIASAATSLVIAQLAAVTERIRVGAGGIMLPNHSPLVIAEQFGTLAQLYPGRIDLGLGRAPGTDQATLRALRRSPATAEHFPQDVLELQQLLSAGQEQQLIQAIPAANGDVPLWILGSSTFGARLAAEFGLPYSFASHFAPQQLKQALAIYREHFKPSAQLDRPHAMVAINLIAAETDAEAKRLFTTQQQSFLGLIRGERGLSKPPVDDIETLWTPMEKAHVQPMLARSYVGSPASLREQLQALLQETAADELMIVSDIHDHAARLRSLALTAELI